MKMTTHYNYLMTGVICKSLIWCKFNAQMDALVKIRVMSKFVKTLYRHPHTAMCGQRDTEIQKQIVCVNQNTGKSIVVPAVMSKLS